MAAWAEDEILIPNGPYRGYRYKQDRLPYARLLLNEIGKWHKHVTIGPVQSGKTFHAFVLVILYYLFEVEEDVICGLPDIEMAGIKWESDIKPAILSSSYAGYLPKTGDGSRGGKPKQIFFKNGRSLLFMGAGGNDQQRAGATSKVLVMTEVDKMDEVSASSKEGQTKIDQLQGRVKSYGLSARVFKEGTLSDEKAHLWTSYEAGTASRIACPCVHCGKWVSPERENFVGWEDAPSAMEAGRKARFSCPECGCFYSEQQRREMNVNGKLVHRGQAVTPEGEVVGPVPDTDTLGFRWSAFNNLLVEMELLGREEWESKYVLGEDADASKREAKETCQLQQTWVRPVKQKKTEGTKLTVGMVKGSALGYAGRLTGWGRGYIPPETDILVSFIDPGKRVLNWGVGAFLPDRRVHIVDYGFHTTSQPDIVGEMKAVEDGLRDLIAFIESKYPVDMGMVDSGYLAELVYSIVKANPLWRASKGVDDGKYRHPKEATDDKWPSPHGDRWHLSHQKDSDIWLANFDPDWFKHRVHHAFSIQPLDKETAMLRDGCVTLFGENTQDHQIYAEQIVAEQFERAFKVGRGFVEGFVQKHADNHQLDVAAGLFLSHSMVRARRHVNAQAEPKPAQTLTPAQQSHTFTTPDGRPFLATER